VPADGSRAASSRRERSGWRRLLPRPKHVLLSLLGLVVVLAGLIVIGYLLIDIPNPKAVATSQRTLVYYADGHTVLGRIGSRNRVDVALSKVPRSLQQAVIAAEDRNYYDEPGISPTGILRALKADVTGGDVSQGGSTITQQYVKNAYLTQQRTFTRKIEEIFIAVKLDRQRSKKQVLEDYLNTIYFGRGAYGVQAASKAYFGKPVGKLDTAQSALLAALIRAPGNYDPAEHPKAARKRWHYVVHGMVVDHALTHRQAAQLRFPHTVDPTPVGSATSGPNGFVVNAVEKELSRHGYGESDLARGGYRITTTIRKNAQDAAIAAEKKLPRNGPEPVSALVAVQPGDGAIRAMYGGRDYAAKGVPASYYNLAMQRKHQPGSSFKPYVLAAALKDGKSLYDDFDGSSPKKVPGYGAKEIVRNDHHEQCPYPCSLLTATYKSINTVYVPLAIDVGPDDVADMAHRIGIPDEVPLHRKDKPTSAGIALGIYPVHVVDQAAGFATFAAGGMRAKPYVVADVSSADGTTVYTGKRTTHRAIDKDIAASVDYALTKVLGPGGTAPGKGIGQPAAGKTGTSSTGEIGGNKSKVRDAWFIGYTPRLSTAVWIGNADGAPLTNVPGYRGGVYGGTLPAKIWQQFMKAALAGKPAKHFPPLPEQRNHPSPETTTQSPASTAPSPAPTTTEPSPSATPRTSSPPSTGSRSPTSPPAPTSPATSPPTSPPQRFPSRSPTATSTGVRPLG
jgi:membrane peptidoglycan carboxypeptidase